MGNVEIVGGAIEASALGRTLGHEHLRTSSEAVRTQFPHLYDEANETAKAVEQVRAAMDHGVKSIVEPSCMDLGRDIGLAQRVVEQTGIQLIMCTGVYGVAYTYLPQHFANQEPTALADAFVHDIEQGIQGSSTKAAFLKCAVDEPGITEHVEIALKAIAEAHKRTGRPIMAHSHPGTRRGLEIMDLFDAEGVDPAAVQVAHTGDTTDLDYIEELLSRGPFIGMDRYGLDLILPAEQRNEIVVELCKRGYADRMVLSHDACATIDWFPAEMVAAMAPDWHFSFIFEKVLPALAEAGVDDDQIDVMLGGSTAAWLDR